MDYKHTCDTIFTHFQGIINNIYDFGRPFLLIHLFTPPPPVHPYFYLSIFVFTHTNDGWTGLYIKLCLELRSTAIESLPEIDSLVGCETVQCLEITKSELHVRTAWKKDFFYMRVTGLMFVGCCMTRSLPAVLHEFCMVCVVTRLLDTRSLPAGCCKR